MTLSGSIILIKVHVFYVKKLSSILVFLFLSISYAQEKEDIIFLFEESKDVLVVKKNEELYTLNKQYVLGSTLKNIKR